MSLTCHFIDDNWERKQVVLNAKAMSGSHTGEYISNMLISLLKCWDISHDRVVLVLRDSGANMVKGLRLAEIPDLSCSAHTIQHITEDLTWTTNTMSLSKKAQQRLHFLRRLKRASLPPPILNTFYRGTIESVLTSCITVWYGNCSAADRKTLQRTVNTAAKIIGAPLPSILDIFLARCSSKTNSIVKDPTHPSHSLFQLLPSGRRYRSIRARSARLLNSFFPQAVRALNSNYPARLWNPMQSPTSWNMDHLPPQQTPPTLPHQRKNCKLFFFCAIQVCYTQVSGPVQTTCSNTLSSMH